MFFNWHIQRAPVLCRGAFFCAGVALLLGEAARVLFFCEVAAW